MKNKKVILIVVSILLLVCFYFAYKGFNLYYYGINNITTTSYDDFINGLSIKNTMTIKSNTNLDNDYLEYDNIKIQNDFKDYEKMNQSSDETSVPKYVLKASDGSTQSAFWMGQTDTYIELLKADKTLFGTEDNRITNTNLTNILEQNNINNDVGLFKYLEQNKNVKNNIFTSVKQMKENYSIHFMASVMLPVVEDITLIDGDYQGYIFNMKNMKEVSILKNGKRYVFMFVNTNHFTDQYINELLNTIIIK